MSLTSRVRAIGVARICSIVREGSGEVFEVYGAKGTAEFRLDDLKNDGSTYFGGTPDSFLYTGVGPLGYQLELSTLARVISHA